ncbi:MAG TPA: pseudouridine synthase [Microvirga sp.]|nr:pseudouridine synthase [Microvirga sp.]
MLPAEARLVADEPAEERIAKVIARAGIASRRDAEAMIADGRVTLNGEVLTSPAVNVGKDDRITVDGEPLPARERTRLWLFHKPRGLVTTARDPEGRPTVFDNLPEDLPRVVAVGRLDINTEGLLLLTNDGGLAKVIAHPDTGWLRRYRVRAHGEVTQADLDRLRDGVTVDGMEYGPVEARLDREQGDNVWITLGLREGKNREVKRILDHLGLSVNRLIRLSFGPFQLGDIEPGLVEEVRTRVLRDQLGEALAAEAGVDFESAVREPIAPFGTKPERDEAPRRREERPARGRDDAPRGGRGRDEDRPARGLDERSPRGRAEPERVKRDPLEPRRSVWRAPGDEPRPARKTPRRGADPREARAQSAEREHERVGAITAGEGRKVLVERLVSAPAPEADDRPRRPRTAGADRPTRRPDRDEAPRSSGDRPYGAKRPAGAGSDRPARSRRPEGASEDRPYRARTGGPGSERPYRARKPEGAGSDRPYRGGKPEGAGSDRPYRARKPEGAGSDRPFRSRDAEPSPRGADDRPRRGPPRGDAPGRGADDRPRRGPPRGDGPGRGGPPGRGGAKGGSKGGAKGGGRSGPGGRGGPRGRS